MSIIYILCIFRINKTLLWVIWFVPTLHRLKNNTFLSERLFPVSTSHFVNQAKCHTCTQAGRLYLFKSFCMPLPSNGRVRGPVMSFPVCFVFGQQLNRDQCALTEHRKQTAQRGVFPSLRGGQDFKDKPWEHSLSAVN